MDRIVPIETAKAPWLMRLVFGRVRKMFGQDLLPARVRARVPRVFWASFWLDALLYKTRHIAPRQQSLVQLRTATRVGCPF